VILSNGAVLPACIASHRVASHHTQGKHHIHWTVQQNQRDVDIEH
jgi:hypothetical protein